MTQVAENVTGTFNKQVTVRAGLLTAFGNKPIAGQPLELEILTAYSSARLGTYYTGNDGYARATITLRPSDIPWKGQYVLGWTYRGNGTYSVPVPTGILTVR